MEILITFFAVISLLLLFMIFKITVVEFVVFDKNVTVKIGGKRLRIKLYDNSSQKKCEKKVKSIDKKSFNLKSLKNSIKTVKEIYSYEKRNIKSVLILLKDRIKVNNIDLSIKFGLGDAALTGIANGAIWSIITLATNLIDRYSNMKKITNIALTPKFTDKCFSCNFKIVVQFRIFKLFKPLLSLYKIYKRNKLKIDILREGV